MSLQWDPMRKNTFLILFLALCIFSVVTTAQTGPSGQNPSLQPTQGSPWSPATTPTGLAPQQRQSRKFKSGEILIKLNSDDAGVLKNDPIIKSVYAEFGTPKVENIFKKSAKAATWDDHFEKVKQRFPTRAKRSHRKAKSKLGRYFKLHFSASDEQLAEIIKRLRKSQNIQSVSYNTMVHVNAVNKDPYTTSSGTWGQTYADLWGLDKISAKKVWATGVSGKSSIIMAVVDSGLDLTHADIIDNLYANPSETAGNGVDDDGNGYIDDTVGWDFVNSDNDPTDDYLHGTHVAGTIAATGNNGIGMAGVMWKAQILPVKVLGADGSGDTANTVNAIMYAVDQGADVINISIKSGGGSELEAAVEYASSLGVVIVASAGNDATDAMNQAPAMYDDVITVASSSSSDELSSSSNFGAKIDVAAPGVDILSLLAADGTVSSTSSNVVGTNYLRISGTSMAAPHVSGVVGLLLAKDPTLTAEEVRQAIRQTDDIGDSGWDEDTGYGRLNALKAVAKPTKCEALITDPDNYSEITSGSFTVSGYAGGVSFARYRLEVYENADGASNLVTSSPLIPVAVSDGTLETLTIPAHTPGGNYSVRLTVYDSAGKICGRDRKEVSGSYILETFDTDGLTRKTVIVGDYAYVADGNSGLQIIDISSPESPSIIGTLDTSGSAYGITINGNYAYVADTTSGLQIIDISDPVNPELIETLDTSGYAYGITVDGSYAYVADGNSGLQIIDISSPESPSIIGTLDTSGSAYGIAVDGSYAYMADGSSGLQIIDISDPVNPVLIGTLDTSGSAYDITVDGSYAYVADGSSGLLIIDIADPSVPFLVSTYDTPGYAYGVDVQGELAVVGDYNFGIHVISLTAPISEDVAFYVGGYDTSGYSYGIAVSGNYAYVADGSSGLQIIKVSNPENPELIETLDTSGSARSIAVSGDYAYVADDSSGLQIIDISSPESPSIIETFDTSGSAYGITINGNYAYVADGSSGLQIIDISDPVNPELIGSYDTSGAAWDITISGNYAYVADYTSGLQIIDISTPNSPTPVGSYDTSENAISVAISDNYAYVADYDGGLEIIDISSPTSPWSVANYPTTSYTTNVTILGTYAYVSDCESGLQILDISTPSSPTLVVNYDTTGCARKTVTDGTYTYVADYYGMLVLYTRVP